MGRCEDGRALLPGAVTKGLSGEVVFPAPTNAGVRLHFWLISGHSGTAAAATQTSANRWDVYFGKRLPRQRQTAADVHHLKTTKLRYSYATTSPLPRRNHVWFPPRCDSVLAASLSMRLSDAHDSRIRRDVITHAQRHGGQENTYVHY
jgi:hypothetical protein